MLNNITLIGRLTADVELKKTQDGKSVCAFTLACGRDFKNSSGETETDFIDVVAWGGVADFAAKYLRKGTFAAVSGRLQTRTWEDRQGSKRKSTEVIAGHVYFAEKRQDRKEEYSAPDGFTSIGDEDIDLPF